VKPASIGSFRIYFPASASYLKATTAALEVQVRPLIQLQKLTTAPALSTTHIIGKVRPRLDGVIYLQRHHDGTWHRSEHVKVKNGKFKFSISPRALGTLKYRVVRHHDPAHLSSISNALKITVVHRTLRYGAVGPDVLALWKRLKELHYDVGAKPGSYGWDLVHAVTAFQKVNGISKDGDAGLSVWKKLAHPKVPHLKNTSSSGYAVEVNMAKEILLISKNGKLWRILDTSTGGGYTYTDSAGEPAVATTPTGHFSFLYKQTGWQTSKLGELYYPSYFTNTGVAVHGEGDGNDGGEVPSYPASHGCVRITNNAVLRYYYKVFTVGTPVWVYR
jgi:peptidoglycan hydrolase-like protein with peptidoglycan-binding domain